MLFREKEMLLRGNEMLLRGNEMLLRGNEILFRGNEILLRGNEILFWRNVIIYRGNEMHITWEWNAFCGKQIIKCIIMSPPGLRKRRIRSFIPSENLTMEQSLPNVG